MCETTQHEYFLSCIQVMVVINVLSFGVVYLWRNAAEREGRGSEGHNQSSPSEAQPHDVK